MILDDTDEFFRTSCEEERKKSHAGNLLKENKRLKKENKDLKARLEELEASTSYKLGRKITYVPGKIKRKLKGSD